MRYSLSKNQEVEILQNESDLAILIFCNLTTESKRLDYNVERQLITNMHLRTIN